MGPQPPCGGKRPRLVGCSAEDDEIRRQACRGNAKQSHGAASGKNHGIRPRCHDLRAQALEQQAVGPTSANSGNTFPGDYDTLGRVFAFGLNLRF